jgi:hypothetical protein
MAADAELAALLVRVDWTALSLSAKVSWRRDFAALQRDVRVRAARLGGTPPRRSRPHAPRFEETASVLVLGREDATGTSRLSPASGSLRSAVTAELPGSRTTAR